ncbi:hypothetical protein [Mycobacterium tilburgii]|uniref:hypothetical protein n=1 Tax=Mycobacterium tilburgii TaxID=44467 RepID=UPI0011836186|nr:hypothetical protein [Mycobacterium tilburgii]
MVRIANKIAAVVGCVALLATGCGKPGAPEPLSAIATPAIPMGVQEVPNPLRGQYEDLLMGPVLRILNGWISVLLS